MSTNDPTSRKFTFDSITNIVPFTARAGDTYLTILEKMAVYLSELAENVNTSLGESAAAVTAAIEQAIQDVDDMLAGQTAVNDTKISDLIDFVNTEVGSIIDMRDDMQEYRDEAEAARDQAEVFSATAVELQDSAVAALVEMSGSETVAALNNLARIVSARTALLAASTRGVRRFTPPVQGQESVSIKKINVSTIPTSASLVRPFDEPGRTVTIQNLGPDVCSLKYGGNSLNSFSQPDMTTPAQLFTIEPGEQFKDTHTATLWAYSPAGATVVVKNELGADL